MNEQYERFFERASIIYAGPGGCCSLFEAVDSGELKNELSKEQYEIAKNVLLDFLNEHNTHPSNRLFGISTCHRRELVERCLIG